jgi:hypothetical protein
VSTNVGRVLVAVASYAMWTMAFPVGLLASGAPDPVSFQDDFVAADLVVITFYKDNTAKAVYRAVEISDPQELKEFFADLRGMTGQCAKCGYDGSIAVYVDKQRIGWLDFNLKCGYISTNLGCVIMGASLISRLDKYRAAAGK